MGLLGESTPQLWEEAKPAEAAITTSPWNPVSCPVQPCSVTELHSSGKAGILFPQHFQLHVRFSCDLETAVLDTKLEKAIFGQRGTHIHPVQYL